MRKSTFLFKLLPVVLFLLMNISILSAADFSVKFVSHETVQLNDQVLIRWVTDSEFNSELFKVQRLVNGASDWEDIGTVLSNGAIPGGGSYEYVDENPAMGLSHYRLLQKDFDGQVTYSDKMPIEVVAFTDDEMNEIVVYPNPAVDEVVIEGPIIIGSSEVQMMDISGRLIAIDLEMDDQQIRIRPLEKVSGLYFVTIFDPYRSIAKKIRFK